MTPAPIRAPASPTSASATGPTARVRVLGNGALVPRVAHAAAGVEPLAPAVCVVPRIPGWAPLAEVSDAWLEAEVGDALDEVLATVQQELDFLRGGRLVFVLPAAPLMGASGHAGASAVTNGVLSMARTLAIELARDSMTVNVLAVNTSMEPDVEGAAAGTLTGQLTTLLGPGGEHVTGQEIYLTAGSDLGRLRP